MDNLISTFQKEIDAKLFYEISRDLASASTPAELLTVVVGCVSDSGLQSATLFWIEADEHNQPQCLDVMAAWEGGRRQAHPARCCLELSHCPLAKLSIEQPNEPLIVDNITHDTRLDDTTRRMMLQCGVAASICLPLRAADSWVGLLTLNWSNAQSFTLDSQYLYASIGWQVATIVYSWRLSHQLQIESGQLATTEIITLSDVNNVLCNNAEYRFARNKTRDLTRRLLILQTACATITSSLNMVQVLQTLAEEMVYFLDLEGCAIHEWLPDVNVITLQAIYASDKSAATAPLGANYDLADYPFTKKVLITGQIGQICVSQKKADPLEIAYMQKHGIKTQVLVPMKFKEQSVGLLEVWDCSVERIIVDGELKLTQLLANQAAIAIENARLFEQAQQEIAERKQTENALRQSEARNRALLNAVPDIIIRVKRDGTYLDIHAPNPDDLILPADELIGKNIFDLPDVLPLDLCNSLLNTIEKSLETGEMQMFTYQIDLRGSQIDFEARMVPSSEDEVISIIRNVTELKQLEEQLRHSHKMEAIGQLAAGIAHDFNNILTSVLGYAELLMSDPATTPAAQQDLERILRQGQRGAHLVRQILDFARKSKAQKQNIDFIELIQETVTKLLERTLPEHIQLTLQTETDSCWILADPDQLQQVLINLALNARDAMPDGGHIRFDLSQSTFSESNPPPLPVIDMGQWLKVTISDTGVGIYPYDLPYIFDPFFTSKEVGQGTGLGLAQVFGIIENHQGHIEVKSEVTRGTVFTIYLPVNSSSLPDSPKLAPPEKLLVSQGQTILLVEDESVVLETLEQMLRKLGYQVLAVSNGRQAFELYQKHQDKIHLVLTDATMPEMDGFELCRRLYQVQPEIKVVIISGYALDHHSDVSQLNGQAIWLPKPVSMKQLEQTLRQLLET